jgi:Rad3-related DNA helicase
MLIDDRFAEPRIQQLLPRWWSLGTDSSSINPLITP